MYLFHFLLIVELLLAILFFAPSTLLYGCSTGKANMIRSRHIVYLICSMSIILLFHAFRNPMSLPDIPEYASAYQEALKYSLKRVIEDGFETLKSEVGFRILIKSISFFFSSYIMLFIITSGIIIYSFYYTIKKYSRIYWVSVLIFIVCHFAQSLFMLRAFLALSLILMSFPFILNRRIIPFLILNALAITIHMSSAIFLPVYFLYGIRNGKFLTFSFLIIGVAVTLVGFENLIITTVERIVPSYSYYIVYIDNYEGASWKMPAILGAEMLLRIYVLRNRFFSQGLTRLLSIITILAFFVYTTGMGFGLTSRMALYFTNMSFLTMADTLYHIKNHSHRLLLAFIYIAFNSFFFIRDSYSELYCNYQLLWF